MSSCIIPQIIALLGHHMIDIGCMIALERDDRENFDYTEVGEG